MENTLLLTIKRMGINGEGIGYYKRKAIFVPMAITGEIVEVKITEDLEKYAYGEVTKYKKMSEHRVKPRCEYYGRCGGCQMQHIDYNYQLEIKRDLVKEAFDKYFEGKFGNVEFRNTIGMENPWEYRNKTQLPTRHDGDKVVVGIYEKDSNRLVYIDKCLIENKLISSTMNNILDYLTKASINVYNPRFRQGNLKYIVLRGFEDTNEVQATFVLNEAEHRLINILKDVIKIDNVESVNYTINNDPKSVEIISGKVINIAGSEQIEGKLGHLNFKISPQSFFQLNSEQTTKLYDEIVKAINPQGTEKVLDLFCGIGSIGLYLSKSVKEVRGIDINKENILNAKIFAKDNNIDNSIFYCDKILTKLHEFEKEGFTPDVVIVDPPRKGLELQLINYFQKSNIKKIIYVSCNPSTLAKNINHLSNYYKINYIQPLDMFPQTSNVECVVCLERR
ncbi:MAG: 23S rRNA (uracil(1939)-C(5))-methyltransferase RlmD [Bacilli bacterium]|nr:23S rRNA (uracil(1939)-C(5))-methyltransferase RlmD [Bacilli bacterium]